MAIHLGSSGKLQFFLDGLTWNLNLLSEEPITNNIRLLSSDNYILKDSNGIYLIPAITQSTVDNTLLSSDGYILQSIDELYLISNINY